MPNIVKNICQMGALSKDPLWLSPARKHDVIKSEYKFIKLVSSAGHFICDV